MASPQIPVNTKAKGVASAQVRPSPFYMHVLKGWVHVYASRTPLKVQRSRSYFPEVVVGIDWDKVVEGATLDDIWTTSVKKRTLESKSVQGGHFLFPLPASTASHALLNGYYRAGMPYPPDMKKHSIHTLSREQVKLLRNEAKAFNLRPKKGL